MDCKDDSTLACGCCSCDYPPRSQGIGQGTCGFLNHESGFNIAMDFGEKETRFFELKSVF